MHSHFESRCIFYLLRLSKINIKIRESFRPTLHSVTVLDKLLRNKRRKKRREIYKENPSRRIKENELKGATSHSQWTRAR